MDKNSNTYTILYSALVVIVVAFLLAFAYTALKERSDANERINTKQQILASLNLRSVPKDSVEAVYEAVVKKAEIVDTTGRVVKAEGGFEVARKDMNAGNLPFYTCRIDSQVKYVVPMVGKGLWGSIWGFLALNADGRTVYGAYFSHESETAGLGALIKEQAFQDKFKDKQAYDDQGDVTLHVVKAGTSKDAHTQVDGITGATLTGNGVEAMLKDYLGMYEKVLKQASAAIK